MLLEQLLEGEYCCVRCEQAVCLEAQILHLNQCATVQSRSLDLTHQMLARASVKEGGHMEEIGLEVGRWFTVRR